MAGRARNANIETPSARAKLARGRMAHWTTLEPGKSHLGWQRDPGKKNRDDDVARGRWIVRQFDGAKYTVRTLGKADDKSTTDASPAMDFAAAKRAALAYVDAPVEPKANAHYTVADAIEDYLTIKCKAKSASCKHHTRVTAERHILPALGKKRVADLTPKHLDDWLAARAEAPRLNRASKPLPLRNDPDAIRARRASANRVLAILRAALNFAHKNEKVASNRAWKIGGAKFEKVETRRNDYWTVEQARRIVNAADPTFRKMLQAALLTGARWSELCQLKVGDYKPDSGKVFIATSKSGHPRYITLTSEGEQFFNEACAGRSANDVMFKRHDGKAWTRGLQRRWMLAACEAAGEKPVGVHVARHSYATICMNNDMDLMIIAENLGHRDLEMLKDHYAHVRDERRKKQIEAHAPKFNFNNDNVVAFEDRARPNRLRQPN